MYSLFNVKHHSIRQQGLPTTQIRPKAAARGGSTERCLVWNSLKSDQMIQICLARRSQNQRVCEYQAKLVGAGVTTLRSLDRFIFSSGDIASTDCRVAGIFSTQQNSISSDQRDWQTKLILSGQRRCACSNPFQFARVHSFSLRTCTKPRKTLVAQLVTSISPRFSSSLFTGSTVTTNPVCKRQSLQNSLE